MSDRIQDADAVSSYRDVRYVHTEDDQFTPIEPCRVPPECTVPVRPGNHAAAARAGCEDEYENAMRARYGEGWD